MFINQEQKWHKKLLYTGEFVKDPDSLAKDIPPHDFGEGTKVYAHHLTVEFKPESGTEGVEHGKESTLFAIGQVVSEEAGVHVILVRSESGEPLSNNSHDHITMSTAENVAPSKSNDVIAGAVGEGTVAEALEAGAITPIEPAVPIRVVQGHFDGRQVHAGPEHTISASRGRGVPLEPIP